MFCPYCGMEIEDNSRFCPYCGEHLDDAVNAPAAPPASVPEIPEEPVQEAPVQEALPPFAAAPAPEQQPVRFDQTNTYQYRQAYTPENPYYGEPAPVQQEKSGKGGKKTLLWILLGAAAALLVASGIILVLALGGKGSSKALGSYLLIRTQDGSFFVNDEKTQLCDEADYSVFSRDYSAAITRRNNKWYYEKNGERTRIGGSDITINRYDEKDCSWVLYMEKEGDLYLFRAGEKEDILIYEEGDYRSSVNTAVSNNGKYLAVCVSDGKEYTIIRVYISTGEMVTIHEDRYYCHVYGVDDNGCVYYLGSNRNSDEVYHIADGKDDVILEDIDGFYVTRDLLICYEENSRKSTLEIYTRPLGMKGELKSLDDAFPKSFLEDSDAFWILPAGRYNGYRADHIGTSSVTGLTSCMIVEYKDDLYFVDLKAETYVIILEDRALNEISDFYLTADMKTAYVRAGKTLYKLTAAKEQWEEEVLTKRSSSLRAIREKGLIYEEDDTDVVVYDGREAVVFEDLAQYAYDISDDFKSAVYVNDNKVMYIKKVGEKAERVAKDNGGARAVLFKNYIYYINEDGELLKMKPGSDPEVVMEDVAYIYHLSY